MSTISTWNDFVSSVGPFIPNPRPLDALKQAGFTLGGEVAKGVRPAAPAGAFVWPRRVSSARSRRRPGAENFSSRRTQP